jgi:hypothetical protein
LGEHCAVPAGFCVILSDKDDSTASSQTRNVNLIAQHKKDYARYVPFLERNDYERLFQ